MKKQQVFRVRINQNVKSKLAEIAAEKGLTMTSYFEQLLHADFEKQGIDIQQLQSIGSE